MIDTITGWISTILPLFLIVMAIIYRNKIKKVVVEFFIALLIMLALTFAAGMAIALMQLSFLLVILIILGLAALHQLASLNLRDTVFAAIFLLLALTYLITGSINDYMFFMFVIGTIIVMALNIKGVGKDDTIPYK